VAVFYSATTATSSRFCGPVLLRVLQSGRLRCGTLGGRDRGAGPHADVINLVDRHVVQIEDAHRPEQLVVQLASTVAEVRGQPVPRRGLLGQLGVLIEGHVLRERDRRVHHGLDEHVLEAL
jgi:hypothetical protein